MNFCTSCGRVRQDSARFCQACGAGFAAHPTARRPERRRRRLIAPGAAALLVVSALTGWAYLTSPYELRQFGARLGLPPTVFAPRCGGFERTGGFEFSVACTERAYVFTDVFLGAAETRDVTSLVDSAVARSEAMLGRSFDRAPQIYILPSQLAFAAAMSGLGAPAGAAADTGTHAVGAYLFHSGLIVINAEATTDMRATLAHELTHALLAQALHPTREVPIWFDEGLATLAEPGGSAGNWLVERRRARVASMASAGTLPSLATLGSIDAWIATSESTIYPYDVSAEVVAQMRVRVGDAGLSRLVQRLGEGVEFGRAFEMTMNQSSDDFSRALPSLLVEGQGELPALVAEKSGDALEVITYGHRPNAALVLDIFGRSGRGGERSYTGRRKRDVPDLPRRRMARRPLSLRCSRGPKPLVLRSQK